MKDVCAIHESKVDGRERSRVGVAFDNRDLHTSSERQARAGAHVEARKQACERESACGHRLERAPGFKQRHPAKVARCNAGGKPRTQLRRRPSAR